MNVRLQLWISAICLIALSSSLAHAQGGKKPGTTLPNVRFEVQFLGTLGTESRVEAMNELGEIVGYSYDPNFEVEQIRATRFTASGPVDLNVEMADLLSARGDGPWLATLAIDINELGQILGRIKIPGGKSQPFLYDPGDSSQGRPRKLDILPHLDSTSTRPLAVNNWGQIVGYNDNGTSFVYSPGGPLIAIGQDIFAMGINDAEQVVFQENGTTLRYTPDSYLGGPGTYESFPFHPSYSQAINLFGDVSGSSRTQTGKNKFVHKAFRAASPNAVELLYSSATYASAGPINDDRDTIVMIDGRPSLYTDMNNLKLLNLDSIVVGTSSALTKWREHHAGVRAMTNRRPIDGTSSFPVMAGAAGLPEQAFILVPRLP